MTVENALPGEPAPRRKPGPKSRAEREADAAAAKDANGSDLSEYETEDLPPAPQPALPRSLSGLSPEQKAEIAQMMAQAIAAARSGQDPNTAAKLAVGQPDRLPSQEEAHIMCEAQIARGIRPRAILTPDGWYTHPESARVRDLGISRLALPE